MTADPADIFSTGYGRGIDLGGWGELRWCLWLRWGAGGSLSTLCCVCGGAEAIENQPV